MKFIPLPNLPKAAVKLAAVDGRIPGTVEKGLRDQGVALLKTNCHAGLQDAVSGHPDMLLHHLGGNLIVYAPGLDEHFLRRLKELDFKLVKGETNLSLRYPNDIAYNVARVGPFAFHHLRYTDPVLKRLLFKQEVEMVHVNQGYTKCSIAVVDEQSIITSDRGIARAAEKKGMDVLLIDPEEGIRLYGTMYGFIGGCSGMLNRNAWALSGDFTTLKSWQRIEAFLRIKGIRPVSLSSEPLMDIGSILPLMME